MSIKFLNVSNSLMLSLLVIIGVLVHLVGLRMPIHQDEGVFLTIAGRIVEGDLPYEDYFDHKPPGIYYVYSLGIWLWGRSMWWVRVLVLIVNLATAWGISRLGLRMWGTNRLGIVAGGMYLLVLPFYQGQYGLTEPFVNFWVVMSLLWVKRSALLVGLCLGIAMVFKQTALLLLPVWLWGLWMETKHLKELVSITIGVGLPWLVLGIYWWRIDLLHGAIEAIWLFNLRDYGFALSSSLGNFGLLVGPFIVVWVSVVWLVVRHFQQTRNYYETMLWWGLLGSSILILIRPYHHYWLQMVPFTVLLVSPLMATRKYWRLGLGINLGLVNLVLAIYGIGYAWPEYERQIMQVEVTDCGIMLPYEYYLSGCRPKKYFFEVK